METHIYIGGKLAREMAESTVYMKWDFEMEYQDDPADHEHSYAIVQAFDFDGNPQDHKFRMAADCREDLDEMFRNLMQLVNHYIKLINLPNEHK